MERRARSPPKDGRVQEAVEEAAGRLSCTGLNHSQNCSSGFHIDYSFRTKKLKTLFESLWPRYWAVRMDVWNNHAVDDLNPA